MTPGTLLSFLLMLVLCGARKGPGDPPIGSGHKAGVCLLFFLFFSVVVFCTIAARLHV